MSTDGEPWSSMSVIERVRWIHHRFLKQNEKKSYEFKIQCAMQLQMPGIGKRNEHSVITAFDNYYQLAYRTGRVWRCVSDIFDLWDKRGVKEQKMDTEMKLTAWQRMQGINDEAILIPVLTKVLRKKLSLQEMAQEFAEYKLLYTVKQAFVEALEEETWSACKARYKQHATDNVARDFVPLFKGWKDPVKKKRAFTAVFSELPDMFNAHIQRARTWLQEQRRTGT